jgi:cell division protein FtsL
MSKVVAWISLIVAILGFSYLLYSQMQLQKNNDVLLSQVTAVQRDNQMLRSQVSSLFSDCTIYSVAAPSNSRETLFDL